MFCLLEELLDYNHLDNSFMVLNYEWFLVMNSLQIFFLSLFVVFCNPQIFRVFYQEGVSKNLLFSLKNFLVL